MTSILLNVRIPPFMLSGGHASESLKSFKWKVSLTMKDAIEDIIKSCKLSQRPCDCVLSLPSIPPETFLIWMEDSRTISSYYLQAKDVLELRTRLQIVRVRYGSIEERFLFDVGEPLVKYVPMFVRKFQVPPDVKYQFHFGKKELEMSKSIREQQLPTDRVFVVTCEGETPNNDTEIDEDHFKNGSALLEAVLEEVSTKEDSGNVNNHDGKKPILEESLQDLKNISAKSVKKYEKADILQVKQGCKKKAEAKWIVLKDIYLLIYRTQNDKKPVNVLSINEYILRLSGDGESGSRKSKENEYFFELEKEDSPKEKDNEDLWIFKCEDEASLKTWMSSIEQAKIKGKDRNESQRNPMSLQVSGPVFGAPLSSVAMANGKEEIPVVVRECVKYIQENALDVVGIFRLSGSAVTIEDYRKAFDAGEKVDLSKESDPHAISGLLKLYFRMLPEPILTFSLYERFLLAQGAPSQTLRTRQIQNLLKLLPKPNFALLKYLIEFLGQVKEHSANNKMGIPNLATVFGPNLLGPPDKSTITMIQDTPLINGIVNTLIQDFSLIFSSGETEDVIAIALYDYSAQDNTEISFQQGESLKVLSQGADGWWEGETNSHLIGRFPGSYVRVESKSKKEKFFEDMRNLKAKLAKDKQHLQMLQDSKVALENEVLSMQNEHNTLLEQWKQFVDYLKKSLSDEKYDSFFQKLNRYHSKIEALRSALIKMEETRRSLLEDFDVLKNFLKSSSNSDPKKSGKLKWAEKLESQALAVQSKLNATVKPRIVAYRQLEAASRDLSLLVQQLKPVTITSVVSSSVIPGASSSNKQ